MKMLKIGIVIVSIIAIVGIIFALTTIEIDQNKINKEITPQLPMSSEIDTLLEEVRIEKIKNDESEKPFIPKDREWVESGPFKIDRSEYLLGEKIFVNIDELTSNDKGKVMTYRPINSTDFKLYHVMPFGESVERNNYYFTPDLSELKGICDVDQLIGEWKMVFDGTEYLDIKFKLTEKIIPGYEERYQTIVNKGKC